MKTFRFESWGNLLKKGCSLNNVTCFFPYIWKEKKRIYSTLTKSLLSEKLPSISNESESKAGLLFTCNFALQERNYIYYIHKKFAWKEKKKNSNRIVEMLTVFSEFSSRASHKNTSFFQFHQSDAISQSQNLFEPNSSVPQKILWWIPLRPKISLLIPL